MRTLLQRALAALATLVFSLLLCFALGQMAPGDAFTQLELDPSLPPATLAALRRQYLPQGPWPERFADWLRAALHGDLGYSLQFHRPVLSLLRQRVPASLEIIVLGLTLAWALGLMLALAPVWFGEWGKRRLERVSRTGAHASLALLAALPLGLLALFALLAAPFSWTDAGSPWLPAGVLALCFLPAVYFQAAPALAAAARKAFLDQGRAAGIAPLRLLLCHALPNTSDELVPLAALTLSQAVVELVIVESLLGWPGIGQLALQAAAGRDMPLLSALVLLASLIVIATNALSDLVQLGLNPRLRRTARFQPLAPASSAAFGTGGSR